MTSYNIINTFLPVCMFIEYFILTAIRYHYFSFPPHVNLLLRLWRPHCRILPSSLYLPSIVVDFGHRSSQVSYYHVLLLSINIIFTHINIDLIFYMLSWSFSLFNYAMISPSPLHPPLPHRVLALLNPRNDLVWRFYLHFSERSPSILGFCLPNCITPPGARVLNNTGSTKELFSPNLTRFTYIVSPVGTGSEFTAFCA